MLKKKKELVAAGLLLASFIVVPFFFEELFPFSRFNLFSDAPKFYTQYMVLDPKDQVQKNISFGLYQPYRGVSQKNQYGIIRPPTINRLNDVASEEAVRQQVQSVLKKFPDLSYVTVTQEVLGPKDEKMIGITQSQTWQINNPFYQE